MTTNYMSLGALAQELYYEEDPPSSSKKENYKRSKREQFKRIIELLGLNIDDYMIEGECITAKGDQTEYHIPINEKALIKYWMKNYKKTKGIKTLEKLEREKRKSNEFEANKINEQIKKAKDEAFMEMSFMVINEYKDNHKELTNIMDILFTKNQYFFSKISETLYLETSNIIEPIFNNLRGERLTKTVIEEDKYIANYKVSDRERPLRLIGQKESIILLLIYKDKIEKLGKELDEVTRLVEEISMDKISNNIELDELNSYEALNNVTEAIKEYTLQKEDTVWNSSNFIDYNEEGIQKLLTGITFKQRIGNIEISNEL